MFKKYLAMSLIVLMFNLAGGGAIFAQMQNDKNAKQIKKIKTKVAKIGTGEKAKVKVELYSQATIKGYISAINDDSFTVTDKKTGATTNVDYTQVNRVSRSGIPLGTKLAIIAAVAVPAIILLTLLGKRCSNEGGCL